jgi:acetyltransferase-like isoleucine patch superfamily enzyme
VLELGTVILPGIRIGAWSVIGAGSVVIRHIPDCVLAYASPARVRRKVEQVSGR